MKNIKIIWIQIILIMMKTMMIMINQNQKLYRIRMIQITKMIFNIKPIYINKFHLRPKKHEVYPLVMLVHFKIVRLEHLLIIHMLCSISILISHKLNLKILFLQNFLHKFKQKPKETDQDYCERK